MEIPAGLSAWLDQLDAELVDHPLRRALVRSAVERTIRDAVEMLPDGTAYVRTGDIPAMWLRDSAAQVRPLLDAFAAPDVADLLVAVSRCHAKYIVIDPYANAFNAEPDGAGYHRDLADQSPWVWERKYEIDSLAWAVDLAYRVWQKTGRHDHLDDVWHEAARATLDLWTLEQRHDTSAYVFVRPGAPAIDTLSHAGLGAPVAYTGMTWSGFRPSDDGCTYGYLVPSNQFAAVALDGIAEVAATVWHDSELEQRARLLARDIRVGVEQYGVTRHNGVAIYAYEVDGYGNSVLMDDANVPSLLSLPYLGFCTAEDPTYLATRACVLSDANPYYARGSVLSGVGSPHTPEGWVWPLGIAMQGLTATTDEERAECLSQLEASAIVTGQLHEAVDPDDPARFTRPWFSWADMTYVDLVLASLGRGGARR